MADTMMTEDSVTPNKLWAGVLSFVLAGVAAALVINIPPPPPPPDLMSRMIDYFAANRARILAASYLDLLSVVAFLVFVADLRFMMRRSGDSRFSTMAFGAGLATASLALVGIAMRATLAFSIAEGGSEFIVRAGYDFMNILLASALIPAAVMVGAVSFAPVRSRILPSWVSGLGAAVVLLALVRPIGLFTTSEALMPGGIAGLAVFSLFGLWILAVSLTVGARPKAA